MFKTENIILTDGQIVSVPIKLRSRLKCWETLKSFTLTVRQCYQSSFGTLGSVTALQLSWCAMQIVKGATLDDWELPVDKGCETVASTNTKCTHWRWNIGPNTTHTHTHTHTRTQWSQKQNKSCDHSHREESKHLQQLFVLEKGTYTDKHTHAQDVHT